MNGHQREGRSTVGDVDRCRSTPIYRILLKRSPIRSAIESNRMFLDYIAEKVNSRGEAILSASNSWGEIGVSSFSVQGSS